jgi:hypothetical protein
METRCYQPGLTVGPKNKELLLLPDHETIRLSYPMVARSQNEAAPEVENQLDLALWRQVFLRMRAAGVIVPQRPEALHEFTQKRVRRKLSIMHLVSKHSSNAPFPKAQFIIWRTHGIAGANAH